MQNFFYLQLIKLETKCNYYEEQIKTYLDKIEKLQDEINELKLAAISNQQHWNIIKILFGNSEEIQDTENIVEQKEKVVKKFSFSMQTEIGIWFLKC